MDKIRKIQDSSYIRKLQEWADKFDKVRNWDAVPPEWVLVHLVEEMGEIARRLLYLGDYKEKRKNKSELEKELGYEICDLIFLACKLANQHKINLEKVVRKKITLNEKRYPKLSGKKEILRYIKRQIDVWKEMKGKIENR